jgi:cytochrome b
MHVKTSMSRLETLIMAHENEVWVWDRLVRVFHWALFIAFFVAYFTEGKPEWLHDYAGYLIVILLLIRVVWGFIGSEHARFSDFVRSPRKTLKYMKDEFTGRAPRYLGHNPAGGLMAILLMLALAVTAFSGMALLAAEEGEGPLAGWLIEAPAVTAHSGEVEQETPLAKTMEEIHEVAANVTLILIILHVLGVIVESWRHHENLIKSMLTGYKRK